MTAQETAAKMVAILRECAPAFKRFYLRRWLSASGSGLWWVSIEVTIPNEVCRPVIYSKSNHFATQSEAFAVELELIKLNA